MQTPEKLPNTPSSNKKRSRDRSKEAESSGKKKDYDYIGRHEQIYRASLVARKFPPNEELMTAMNAGFAADDNKQSSQSSTDESKLEREDTQKTENQTTPRKNKFFWPKIDDKSKPKNTPKNGSAAKAKREINSSTRTPRVSKTTKRTPKKSPISVPQKPSTCSDYSNASGPKTPSTVHVPLNQKLKQNSDEEYWSLRHLEKPSSSTIHVPLYRKLEENPDEEYWYLRPLEKPSPSTIHVPLYRKLEQNPGEEYWSLRPLKMTSSTDIITGSKFGGSCKKSLDFGIENQDKRAADKPRKENGVYKNNNNISSRIRHFKYILQGMDYYTCFSFEIKKRSILIQKGRDNFRRWMVPRKKRTKRWVKSVILKSLIKHFKSFSCNASDKDTGRYSSRRENEDCSGENQADLRTGSNIGLELVPYKRRGKRKSSALISKEISKAMTVYKNKYNPKIEFDKKTNKVWNLLMMGNENPDQEDDDQTKAWWKNEKITFSRKAMMFIKFMNMIQGDKRFSLWKGSVVDSVVGVFLTQNVADVLSSSTFMALASKYPINQNWEEDGDEHKNINQNWEEDGDEHKNNGVKDVNSDTQNHNQNDQNSKDWDELRIKYSSDKPRNPDTFDSVDYDAVRRASIAEVADVIKIRGQNVVLATRIKKFLDRIVQDHGSIDLEWLREVTPHDAKEYLLSIEGIGLKSVECIRLLCLRHHAFPVDTNVGRIAVRLGWIPLKPLPEDIKFHELTKYPSYDVIQKYLWPRLQEIDKELLFELHYHMITAGKTICRKSNPNCNVCPMQRHCKYYASKLASTNPQLPPPEEPGFKEQETYAGDEDPVKNTTVPNGFLLESNNPNPINRTSNCEPTIEYPDSPGYGSPDRDIEELSCDNDDDDYDDDVDDNVEEEMFSVVLNPETLRKNILAAVEKINTVHHQNSKPVELVKDIVAVNPTVELVKDIVAVNPETASIPPPKFKSLSRLRTIHQVYELEDDNPILEGFEKRDPDDPCPYLFKILITGESGDSKDNVVQEHNDEIILGSVLIPSRTANRGFFPLNGTYFQPNEVFADYETSQNPIPVSRELLWNKPLRSLYCGTSVSSIHRGFTTSIEVQQCCANGYYCTRGFERTIRAPRPLPTLFHPHTVKNFNNKEVDVKVDEN